MTTPERLRRRQHIIEVMVGVTLAVVGIGMVWQNHTNEVYRREQDRKIEAAVYQNTIINKCLSKLAMEITETTSVRSEATVSRDKSDLAKEKAMSIVMRERVQRGTYSSSEILEAAKQWQYQYKKWEKESYELEAARNRNPPPDFSDYCPKPESIGTK